MQRVANFQARSAKNKMKPKKMKAMSDIDQGMYSIKMFNVLLSYFIQYVRFYR
jgi:hypothetical protein